MSSTFYLGKPNISACFASFHWLPELCIWQGGGDLDLGHLCPRIVFLKYPQEPCSGSLGRGEMLIKNADSRALLYNSGLIISELWHLGLCVLTNSPGDSYAQ